MVVAVGEAADAALVVAVVSRVVAVSRAVVAVVAGIIAVVVLAMASLLRAATGARAGAGLSARTKSYALA